MSSPEGVQGKYAAQFDWAGIQIFNLVRQSFKPEETTILDVGAGWGKYRYLLPDYTMDACEVWVPYVNADKLVELYRNVYVADICDLEIGQYDVIIMGDVLEHIPREKAKQLITRLVTKCKQIYVVVPYLYPQGEVEGNPYEIHHQADLTEKLMEKEYPELELLANSPEKGIYVKR